MDSGFQISASWPCSNWSALIWGASKLLTVFNIANKIKVDVLHPLIPFLLFSRQASSIDFVRSPRDQPFLIGSVLALAPSALQASAGNLHKSYTSSFHSVSCNIQLRPHPGLRSQSALSPAKTGEASGSHSLFQRFQALQVFTAAQPCLLGTESLSSSFRLTLVGTQLV